MVKEKHEVRYQSWISKPALIKPVQLFVYWVKASLYGNMLNYIFNIAMEVSDKKQRVGNSQT